MFSRRLLGSRVLHKHQFYHCPAATRKSQPMKIKVKQGTVVGGEQPLPNGKPYYYFKGIPYAVPPLGELRFQAPVPLESFAVPELECTKDGDVSFQADTVTRINKGSENCLFLNVFTPESKIETPLPVVVFIHGGRYMTGSGNSDFYTPLYLLQENVLVVTVNYRQGPLGFLALPEANIPGNAGLKDQRLALQWVKENIAQFNGDPNNVTLFGESSGGACVHLQVFSDSSKKLFHKAIINSGTANMHWAVQNNPTSNAITLAKLMGCTSTDPIAVSKFLKSQTELGGFVKHMLSLQTPEERRRSVAFILRPVIEEESPEAILTEEALKSMHTPNVIDIPIMMGYNSAEGIILLPGARRFMDVFDKDLARLIPIDINLDPEDPRSLELANTIRDFYFKGARVDANTVNEFVQVYGDFHFTMHCWTAAEIHARKQHNSPLFFFRFDYVGALNMYKKMFQSEQLKGACHGDELFYLFQAEMAPEPWEDRDKKMVQTMCKLWANFAKHGNPTPKESEQFVDCAWEPVRHIGVEDEFSLNAFIIDEKQRMVKNPDGDRADFWKRVYRKYNGALPAKL